MFLTSVSSVIYQINKIVLDFSGPRQCLWNTACRLSRRAAGSWKICAEHLVQGVNCTQCTFSWVHCVSSKLLGVGTACESTAITFFFFSPFFLLLSPIMLLCIISNLQELGSVWQKQLHGSQMACEGFCPLFLLTLTSTESFVCD